MICRDDNDKTPYDFTGSMGPRDASPHGDRFGFETADSPHSLQDLIALSQTLGKHLAAGVHTQGPQAAHLALLTVLTHLSPVNLVCPNGRALDYAPLQVLIIGESGSLKSTIVGGLSQEFGRAEIACADTATRAGLLYQIGAKHVKPGLLPRNHQGMVVIDEFHKIKHAEITAATSARTQGQLVVEGQSRDRFDMQTRLICIANFKQRGRGASSLGVDDLDGIGIQGTSFLEPEDLRRFDIVATAIRSEAETSMAPATSLEWMHSLICQTWQQDAELSNSPTWEDGAHELSAALAEELNEVFDHPQIPLFGPSTQDKLLRLAAAAARLFPVSKQQTLIKRIHVEWGGWFLLQNYRMPGNGLATLAASHRRRHTFDPEEMRNDFHAILNCVPELWPICEAFLGTPRLTTSELANAVHCSPRTASSRVRILKEAALVTSHGSAGLRATPRMLAMAKAILPPVEEPRIPI